MEIVSYSQNFYLNLYSFNKIHSFSADSSIFTHREISFTLEDDIYIRYLSFEDQAEFEKEICSRIPFKIDIGAVYNFRPKHRMTVAKLIPQQRELVFDIDMTDYDPVRTCCQEANVCEKCWKFMTVACKVLDVALRDDFDFKNLLWVFSGRRGIHCWVCDKTARTLNERGRSAVANYLNILQPSGPGKLPRVLVGKSMHYSIKRAYKIIEPYFKEIILEDQDLFATVEGRKKLIGLLPEENWRKEFDNQLKKVHLLNSESVWDTFVTFVEQLRTSTKGSWKLRYLIEETQMAFLYPRLDINVSKGFNHLLKAPFCVHPKSGKVCVPFNPNAVTKFNPNEVPTIHMLMEEINQHDKEEMTQAEATQTEMARIKDYKKTKMFKGIVVFEEFLRKLEMSNRQSPTKAHKNVDLDF